MKIKEHKINHWKWFLSQWKQHGIFACLLVGMTLLSTTVTIVGPIFFSHLINKLSSLESLTGDPNTIKWKFLGVLFVAGFARFIAGWYPFLRARMNLTFEKLLREEYFAHLLNGKDHSFQYRAGDLITRLTDDLAKYPKISWFACSGIFRAFDSFFVVIVCVAIMFYLNHWLALASLLPLPLALLVYHRISGSLEDSYCQIEKMISKTNEHLDCCFSGIKVLKAYSAECAQFESFNNVLENRLQEEYTLAKLASKVEVFYESINYIAQIVVVILGGIMVIQGNLSLGDFYAFYAFLGIIVYPMLDIPYMFITAKQSFVCVDRLEELKPKTMKTPADYTLASEFKSLELKNLCFSHGNKQVLQNISLKLKPGEKLAIVGKIGAGKTTLLNLAAGLLSPAKGQVLLNDRDISSIQPDSVYKMIGLISQQPLVFSESVAENISFFRSKEQEQIEKAAELGMMKEEINLFPQKYQEKLGQKGVNISGGQKQRLTIARALAGDPDVLLMDDVTASLDAANEELFWSQLEETDTKIAVIAVTHRMATAKKADRILVLDKGRIVGSGTYDQLIKTSDVFKSLAN
jgi:ATP-binding cassette subfamily B protein